MNLRAFALVCLASLLLAACNFPSAGQPAEPGVVATPTGNLAVAGDYLTGIRLVSHDSFDNLRDWIVEPADSTLTNGVLLMTGTSFWHSHLIYKQDLAEGQGLLIDFSVQQADAQSELVLVSGEWRTTSFRQFGVYNAVRPLADLFQGTADLGGQPLLGDLRLRPSTTYTLLLAVGPRGHLEAVVWDPAAPAQRAVYDLQGDPSWVGRKWTFMPKANAGETIYLDNFYRISFTDIK